MNPVGMSFLLSTTIAPVAFFVACNVSWILFGADGKISI